MAIVLEPAGYRTLAGNRIQVCSDNYPDLIIGIVSEQSKGAIMLFIIDNGDKHASMVPGAHQEEVTYYYGEPRVVIGVYKVWVADLTVEQLARLCLRSKGYIAIQDRSVKEMKTNSLGALHLILQ